MVKSCGGERSGWEAHAGPCCDAAMETSVPAILWHYLARSNPSTPHVFTLRFMLESEHSGAPEKKRRNEQDNNSCWVLAMCEVLYLHAWGHCYSFIFKHPFVLALSNWFIDKDIKVPRGKQFSQAPINVHLQTWDLTLCRSNSFVLCAQYVLSLERWPLVFIRIPVAVIKLHDHKHSWRGREEPISISVYSS